MSAQEKNTEARNTEDKILEAASRVFQKKGMDGARMQEIADELGVSESTIHKWISKHNIESRSVSEARELLFQDSREKYRDETWLREQYWGEGKSAYEIADICDVSPSTIQYFFEKFELEMRSQKESTRARNNYPKYYDKEWLTEQYKKEMKSTVEIATECGVTTAAIRHWLHKHNIEMRTLSEAMYNRDVSGENHPRWRENSSYYYGTEWEEKREKAIQRDDEKCQLCGIHRDEHQDKHGSDLHVHHIKPANEFDMVSEAHSLDNLVTLCRSDHNRWEGIPLRPEVVD